MTIRKITGATSGVVVSASTTRSGIAKATTRVLTGIQRLENLSDILIPKVRSQATQKVDHIFSDPEGQGFRKGRDYFTPLDRTSFFINKTNADNISVFEQLITYLVTGRVFSDAVNLTDVIRLVLNEGGITKREFIDAVIAGDVARIVQILAPYRDIQTVLDSKPVFFINKRFADTTTMVDLAGVFDGITYNYGLSRTDATTVLDSLRSSSFYVRGPRDGFSDSIAETDRTRFYDIKSLRDSTTETDRISFLDQLIKTDATVVTDIKALFVNKLRTDSITESDSIRFTALKSLADTAIMLDSFSFGDNFTYAETKLLQDAIAAFDQKFLFVNKPLAPDAIVVTDVKSLYSNLVKADAVTQTDFRFFYANKSSADSITETDFRFFFTGKSLADAQSVNDAVRKLALLKVSADSITESDSRYFWANKVLTDTELIADAKALFVRKPLQDTQATADNIFKWLAPRPLADSLSTIDTDTLYAIKRFYDSVGVAEDQTTLSDGFAVSQILSRADTVLVPDYFARRFNVIRGPRDGFSETTTPVDRPYKLLDLAAKVGAYVNVPLYRTNLVTYSEQFDYWTPTNVVVTNSTLAIPQGVNRVASYDATQAAEILSYNNGYYLKNWYSLVPPSQQLEISNPDFIAEDTSTGEHLVNSETITVTNNQQFAYAVYLKYDSRKYILVGNSAGPYAVFNIQTGTIQNRNNVAANITPVGDGWYLCSIKGTAATGSYTAQIQLLNDGLSFNYTGNGTSGVYAWGAQLEADTQIQEINSLTYIATQSTPRTIVGYNMMPDDRERVFAGTMNRYNSTRLSNDPYENVSFILQNTQRDSFLAGNYVNGIRRSGDTLENVQFINQLTAHQGANKTVSGTTVTAPSSLDTLFVGQQYGTRRLSGDPLEQIAFLLSRSGYDYADYITEADNDYFWMNLVTKQGLNTDRARGNFYAQSSNFADTTNWTTANAIFISSNVIIAPDGTLTADKLIESATTAQHVLTTLTTPVTTYVGSSYTLSVYVKSAGQARYLSISGIGATGASEVPIFNPDTGIATIPATNTIVKNVYMYPVSNGWYRCVMQYVCNSANARPNFNLTTSTTYTANPNYAGNGTSGLYIWGAQLNTFPVETHYVDTTSTAIILNDNTAVDTDVVGIGTYHTGNRVAYDWLENLSLQMRKDANAGVVYSVSGTTVTAADGDRLFVGQQYGNIRFSGDPLERLSWLLLQQKSDSVTAPDTDNYWMNKTAKQGSTSLLTRGNLLAWSDDFTVTTSWVRSAVLVTSNVIAAPNGTLTADKLSEATASTSAGHYVYQAFSTLAGTSQTLIGSIFVKPAERSKVLFGFSDLQTYGPVGYFDLSSNTLYTQSAENTSFFTNFQSTIRNVGNGWSRISFSATRQTQSGGTMVYVGPLDDTWNWGTTTGAGIYIWGAQVEAHSVLGHYYPTTTSAFTLSANTSYDTDRVTIGTYVAGPRLAYDPVENLSIVKLQRAAQGASSILIQGNMVAWSEEVANWSVSTSLQNFVTSNNVTAPNGTLTGDSITFNGGGYRYNDVSVSLGRPIAGNTYTASAWLWSTTGKATIGFRLTNAADGTDNVGTSVTLTTTPTRVYITRAFTGGASPATNVIQVGLDNRTGIFGDNVTGTVAIWGLQVEAHGQVGTYYPTAGAPYYTNINTDYDNDEVIVGSPVSGIRSSWNNQEQVKFWQNKLLTGDGVAMIDSFSFGDNLTYLYLQQETDSFLIGNGVTGVRRSGDPLENLKWIKLQRATQGNDVYRIDGNILANSEDFTNVGYWAANIGGATSNVIVAPDGTTTADKLFEFTGTSFHGITYQGNPSNAINSGSSYTISVYIKSAGQARYLQIIGLTGVGGATNEVPVFNPDTGTVTLPATSSYVKTAYMYPVGNGWYRCVMQGIGTNAFSGSYAYVSLTLTTSTTQTTVANYAGTYGTGLHIWGAQLTTYPVETDYVRTTAGAIIIDTNTSADNDEVRVGALNKGFRIAGDPLERISITALKLAKPGVNYTVSGNTVLADDGSDEVFVGQQWGSIRLSGDPLERASFLMLRAGSNSLSDSVVPGLPGYGIRVSGTQLENFDYIGLKSARAGTTYTISGYRDSGTPNVLFTSVTVTAADTDRLIAFDDIQAIFASGRVLSDLVIAGSDTGFRLIGSNLETTKFWINKRIDDTTPALDFVGVYDGLTYSYLANETDSFLVGNYVTGIRRSGDPLERLSILDLKDAKSGLTYAVSGTTVTATDRDRLFVGQQYGNIRFSGDPLEKISFLNLKVADAGTNYSVSGTTVTAADYDRVFVGKQYGDIRFSSDPLENTKFLLLRAGSNSLTDSTTELDIDYFWMNKSAKQGTSSLLVDGNLLTFSADFATSIGWSLSLITVSSNVAVSPINIFNTTADRILENTTNGQHLIFQSATPMPLTSVTYTMSAWVKYDGVGPKRDFVMTSFGESYVAFDTVSGTVISNSAGYPAGVVAYPNNWFRCWATIRKTNGIGDAYYGFWNTGGGNNVYAGTTGTLLIYGAQVTATPYLTNYVETTSTVVKFFNNTATDTDRITMGTNIAGIRLAGDVLENWSFWQNKLLGDTATMIDSLSFGDNLLYTELKSLADSTQAGNNVLGVRRSGDPLENLNWLMLKTAYRGVNTFTGNLITYSEQFDQWLQITSTSGSAVVIPDTTSAPLIAGLTETPTSADTVTLTGYTLGAQTPMFLTTSTSTYITTGSLDDAIYFNVWIRAVTNCTSMTLIMRGAGGSTWYLTSNFNFVNGSAGSGTQSGISGLSWGKTGSVGDWFRYTVSLRPSFNLTTPSSISTGIVFGIRANNTDSSTVNTFQIWGANLRKYDNPTLGYGYIQTTSDPIVVSAVASTNPDTVLSSSETVALFTQLKPLVDTDWNPSFKGPTDINIVYNQGLIRNTNYVNLDYIADDYVGDSRVITY